MVLAVDPGNGTGAAVAVSVTVAFETVAEVGPGVVSVGAGTAQLAGIALIPCTNLSI